MRMSVSWRLASIGLHVRPSSVVRPAQIRVRPDVVTDHDGWVVVPSAGPIRPFGFVPRCRGEVFGIRFNLPVYKRTQNRSDQNDSDRCPRKFASQLFHGTSSFHMSANENAVHRVHPHFRMFRHRTIWERCPNLSGRFASKYSAPVKDIRPGYLARPVRVTVTST